MMNCVFVMFFLIAMKIAPFVLERQKLFTVWNLQGEPVIYRQNVPLICQNNWLHSIYYIQSNSICAKCWLVACCVCLFLDIYIQHVPVKIRSIVLFCYCLSMILIKKIVCL